MAITPKTANLLRELRNSQGRSLRGAAADIGVAPSQLSRIERGQRGLAPEVSKRLSVYYEVSEDFILLSQGEVPQDIVQILANHPEVLDELRQRFSTGSAE